MIIFKSKNTFEGQLYDEKTIFTIRQHWFVIFIYILTFALLITLPFFIYYWVNKFLFDNLTYKTQYLINEVFKLFSTFYSLIIYLGFFYSLMRYILTIMIVTNKRVIIIYQEKFFKYERIEAPLNKIQDISIIINGLLATFLNFGNLEIQTAGAITKFKFIFTANPIKIKYKIMEEANKYLKI